MEKITITIETSNDAFYGGYEKHELARVLRDLADKIMLDKQPRAIMDINGNKVGTVEYE